MTQEEKNLLLKDLCARLPYGVKCQIKGEESLEPITLKSYMNCDPIFAFDFYLEENSSLDFKELGEFKPYLISLEKLPQEKRDKYNSLLVLSSDGIYYDTIKSINWCYENHVDINGLIDLGLANDATELNIY